MKIFIATIIGILILPFSSILVGEQDDTKICSDIYEAESNICETSKDNKNVILSSDVIEVYDDMIMDENDEDTNDINDESSLMYDGEKTTSKDSKDEKHEVVTDYTDEFEDLEVDVVIDNDEIEECFHEYVRSRGTGGEEGDVWDYVCIKCGYSYYEPRYDEGLEISDDDFENCNEASDVGSFVEAEETDSNDPTIDEESHDCEVSVLRTDEELE